MRDERIVHVRTERYDVFASWYVILTDNNEPVGLRSFDALVIYPDGHQSEYYVYDLPLSIVRGIGLLGEVHDDAQG
jgi:hypothetical protein